MTTLPSNWAILYLDTYAKGFGMVQRSLPGSLRLFYLVVVLVSATLLCTKSRADVSTILFIGNSFTFADKSPVHYFRHETVTDLNGERQGGVPALFKAFTVEAGLDYTVNLETSGGKGLDWHYKNRADLIGKPWDVVVMHGYSTLDAARPGDPGVLIRSAKDVAALLVGKNPKVMIYLMATWTRADQTYLPTGHWYGKPVDAMEKDVRAGYDQAAAASPSVKGVIPVGQAWERAIVTGFADANPYDGIDASKVDLWADDNYHGSMYGYYLEALTVFGDVTGLDPRSLGREERTASELGISPDHVAAMEQIAYDELSEDARLHLKPFFARPLVGDRAQSVPQPVTGQSPNQVGKSAPKL